MAVALYNVGMHSRREAPRMTRREWATLAAASPLLGQVTQKTPPERAPKPAPTGATPQERLHKAIADVKQVSDRLAQLEVPMNVEPAFAFRP